MKPWLSFLGLFVVGIALPGCRPDKPVSLPSPASSTTVSPTSTGVAPADPAAIVFRDRTEQSGVRFTYRNDDDHSNFSILESLGGGVAVFDFDQDSHLDLLIPGGGAFGDRQAGGVPSALFRNQGGWQFVEITDAARIGRSAFYSHGAAAADFNEDGFDDVVITGYGGLMLYQNQGDGTFVDVTPLTGLTDRLWSSSAAWGDFNGDGALDLYVAHYVDWSFDKHPVCAGPPGHPREVCPPKQFAGLPDVIYYSNGDGSFVDATQTAGLQPDGKGLGVVSADVDLDGDVDIYVANDTVGNFLYRNDGSGVFEDISSTSGTAVSDRGTPDGSMGVDVGDFNGDGLPDIWVTNYERENSALYRNMGHGLFRHVSQSAGIAAIGSMFVGWGTRFIDADLDGDEDLIVANGHVIRFPQNTPRLQLSLVLQNMEGKRYHNVSKGAGDYFVTPHSGRGLATGDLDGDGDEDVVVSNMNEPVAVLENESKHQGNWLAVRILGRQSCRSAIGAVVVARVGDKRLLRQIRGGSSFASTSDSKLHFAVGPADQIDDLTITWIGGSRLVLQNVACDRVLTVVEPAR